MAEPPADAPWRPSPLLGFSAGLHLAAGAAWLAAPAAWPLWAGLVVADQLLVAAACVTPRGHLLGPNLTRLPPPAAGRVALTFDDGPDPRVTPRVLDLLAERGVRASFFVIGRRAAEHPRLVAEMARRGHRVENHSYRHSHHFAFLGPRAQGREIDRAQDIVEDLTGRRPEHFRPPAGMRSPWLDHVLARRRLGLASWTRRGFDTVDREPRRVSRRLLRGLAGGDVLLLHDGSAAIDCRGRPVVLEVLPRLLDALAERRLRATPLPARRPVARPTDGR